MKRVFIFQLLAIGFFQAVLYIVDHVARQGIRDWNVQSNEPSLFVGIVVRVANFKYITQINLSGGKLASD